MLTFDEWYELFFSKPKDQDDARLQQTEYIGEI